MNGANQTQTPQSAVTPGGTTDNKFNTIVWVVIAVGVLVVLGIVFYYFYAPSVDVVDYGVGGFVKSREQAAANSISATENELKGMDVEGLDTELGDIDKELK